MSILPEIPAQMNFSLKMTIAMISLKNTNLGMIRLARDEKITYRYLAYHAPTRRRFATLLR